MIRSVLFLALLLLSFAGPAAAQSYGGGGRGGAPQGGSSASDELKAPSSNSAVPPDPFSIALAAKRKGDIAKAITILKSLSERGSGYEVAQFELGKIYYESANKKADTADAQAERTLGFGWILHAAAGGLGTAEAKLVQICLDGDGTPPSRIEAAKWFLLWRQNPSRMQLGTSQFDENLERRLRSSTTEPEWAEAQQRAIAFVHS